MYLPPRSTAAQVHEFLVPGVEIVAVDPDCVYNSPASSQRGSGSSSSGSSSSSAASDDDDDEDASSVATGEYLLRQQQQQSPHVIETTIPADAAFVAGQTSGMPDAMFGDDAAMMLRSQTCLDTLDEVNFDLAAYITDNDYGMLPQSHQPSTAAFSLEDDTTNMSALQAATHVSTMTGPTMVSASAISQSALEAVAQQQALLANDADTYRYVEKWLESCLHDDENTADSICRSLVDDSPVKLLMGTLNDSATPGVERRSSLGKQNVIRSMVGKSGSKLAGKRALPVVSAPASLVNHRTTMMGKGRGKAMSMMFGKQNGQRNGDDDEEEETEDEDDEEEAKQQGDDDEDDDDDDDVDVEETDDLPPALSSTAARTSLYTAYRNAKHSAQASFQQQSAAIVAQRQPAPVARLSSRASATAPVRPSATAIPTVRTTQTLRTGRQSRLPVGTQTRSRVLEHILSEDDDDEVAERASMADSYAPSQSSQNSSSTAFSQKNTAKAQRPKRAAAVKVVALAAPAQRSVQRNRAAENAAADLAANRRQYRSKSYVSSSSGSSDDEQRNSNKQTTSRNGASGDHQRINRTTSDTNPKLGSVQGNAKITIRTSSQQPKQPSKKTDPTLGSKKTTTTTTHNESRSLLKKNHCQQPLPASSETARDIKRYHSADALPAIKRHPSNERFGALDETLLSLDATLLSARPRQARTNKTAANQRSLLLTQARQQTFKSNKPAQPPQRPLPSSQLPPSHPANVGVRPPRTALLRVCSMETLKPAVLTPPATPASNSPAPHFGAQTSVASSNAVHDERPPPAPEPKKLINLDEYLKRRRQRNAEASQTQPSDASESKLLLGNFKIPKRTAAGTISDARKITIAPLMGFGKPKDAGVQTPGNRHLEEIVIVSMGCNTDVTLPCGLKSANGGDANDGSRLLTNINDTIIRAQSAKCVQISSNSLIASIQDVLIKKCIPMDENNMSENESNADKNTASATSTGKAVEHGEDKIVMYLPRNRHRHAGVSVECQTESTLQFAPLKRLRRQQQQRNYRCQRSARRHRQRRSSSRRSATRDRSSSRSSRSSWSSGSTTSSRSSCASRMSPRSRSSSASTSSSRSSSGGSSAYRSDRSRSRATQNTAYRKKDDGAYHQQYQRPKQPAVNRRKRQHSQRSSTSATQRQAGQQQPMADGSYRNGASLSRSDSESSGSAEVTRSAPKKPKKMSTSMNKIYEERRIVYVGRIEEKTTRDDLRRKFIGYGPIRQISIHYKDTGMKFGFVTYEHAKDAYRAIESSSKDPVINVYDISFGGRRAFCKSSYIDFDGGNPYETQVYTAKPSIVAPVANESFEELLRKMREKLSEKRATTVDPMPSC